MMNIFIKNNSFVVRKNFSEIQGLDQENTKILWIDLLHPTAEEVIFIAKTYELEIPTKEEREEIEQSARYWEDNSSITINSYFLMRAANFELKNETVTFLLHNDILFTIRYGDFKVFDEIQQRVLANPKNFQNGFHLMSKIYEVRVEKDADMLENIGDETKILRKGVFDKKHSDYDDILEKLSNLQEVNMSVRDSLFDKRRAIILLLKSEKVDPMIKKDMDIILKDINSLVEFTTANMNILDNVQNLFTNQINIEQNKIIKLFTVVTVVMMPPTLIGTIYGMNFRHMPELEWSFGYPIAIGVMVISTILPLIYFKKKKWL